MLTTISIRSADFVFSHPFILFPLFADNIGAKFYVCMFCRGESTCCSLIFQCVSLCSRALLGGFLIQFFNEKHYG